MSTRGGRRLLTWDELRESLRQTANNTRDAADEIAAKFDGCDDPLHPWGLTLPYRDWLDFTEQVCRPIVEAEGDEEKLQEAMRAYRAVNPYYIAAALVMAANRVKGQPAVASPAERFLESMRAYRRRNPRPPST